LVAVTVKVLIPGVVGVPLSAHPEESVTPGNDPPVILQVGVGVPVTVIAALYAASVEPLGRVAVVIAGAIFDENSKAPRDGE
jgi:hypothetical protein